MHINRTLHIYVSKGVRIHGYFSNPQGVRKQKRLGKTVLTRWTVLNSVWETHEMLKNSTLMTAKTGQTLNKV
jgi:hypothetical protein